MSVKWDLRFRSKQKSLLNSSLVKCAPTISMLQTQVFFRYPRLLGPLSTSQALEKNGETSLANLLIHLAPCSVIVCFCFVFGATLAFLHFCCFWSWSGQTYGRTDTMCETNDHLLAGALWIKRREMNYFGGLSYFRRKLDSYKKRLKMP